MSAYILRPPQAATHCGVSKPTLYRMAKDPNFPKKIRLSARCVGWRIEDLDNWLKSREVA